MGVLLFRSNKNSAGGRIDKAMEIIPLTDNRRAWVSGPLSLYPGDDFCADAAISNLRFRCEISDRSFARWVK
jgi:hypothetical protein